jgi:hypothetical protein
LPPFASDFTFPEHLGSPPVFGGVRVARSLVLCVCFVLLRLAIVLSVLRYTDSDCPFGIFKLFFFSQNKINAPNTHIDDRPLSWLGGVELVLWVLTSPFSDVFFFFFYHRRVLHMWVKCQPSNIARYCCKEGRVLILRKTNTGKPVHAVTSIKQSPVLKGHLFLVLS